MKEIGEKLKEARQNNGVNISEVAEDLKIKEKEIEDLEEGNIKAFKDVFELKYFIREYAKYLGLDSEKLVDEFNEFLFDYTSKIPVEEIEKAKKEDKKKQEPKKIVSPYTVKPEKKFGVPSKLVWIAVAVLLLTVMYFLVSLYANNSADTTSNDIEYKGV